MTERVKQLLELLQSKEYRKDRVVNNRDITDEVRGMSLIQLSAYRFCTMMASEQPVLHKGDRIGFHRYAVDFPWYIREENGKKITGCNGGGNLTPDYNMALSRGLDAILEEIHARQHSMPQEHQLFLEALESTVNAALELADRYRKAAEHTHPELYQALLQVPHRGAETFLQACVFMNFILYTLRCNANFHITLGSFDRYMLPYYQADRNRGVSKEELLEILEEFFISINLDSDLYYGMQQGDNGQSMVLGGYDATGKDCFNELSELCMKASMELSLIDPKINLRVHRDTPFSLYLLGTHMTKAGLGFPQYSNDDVVIPGLEKLGYEHQDAVNYTVAACWEFIIPGCGADIPNIASLNFPKVVNDAIHAELEHCDTYEELWQAVRRAVNAECERLIAKSRSVIPPASPNLSLYIDGCLTKGKDISEGGAKYYNYGFHGTGLSNAADALAAVRKTVYEDGSVSKAELLQALDRNFEGTPELRKLLLNCPKMGNNDDRVDEIGSALLDAFADSLKGKTNDMGGIYRAGTGSALEYLRSGKAVPATADGRLASEAFASSYSPAITTRLNGLLSVIQSFTKYDLTKTINGGPLTIEIHDTTFRNEDGIEKVAKLVQLFIERGGHQLQLNSINRERLLDAQKHPEKYPNLIVRVWGWSGYFNELDLGYQEHIIRRTEFCM